MADKRFAIVCDDGCDLPQGLAAQLGVELVSPACEEGLSQAYGRLVDAGATEIVSLHNAGAVSGAADDARHAARAVAGRAMVFVVDTGTASVGTGIIVERVAAARVAGASAEQAVLLANRLREGVRLYTITAAGTRPVRRRSVRRRSSLVRRADAVRVRMTGECTLYTLHDNNLAQADRSVVLSDLTGRIAHAMSAMAQEEGPLCYAEVGAAVPRTLQRLEKPLDTNEFEARRLWVCECGPATVADLGEGAVGVAVVSERLWSLDATTVADAKE